VRSAGIATRSKYAVLIEVLGAREAARQLAGRGGPVLIQHREAEVLHLAGHGVPEHEQLDHRNDEEHAEHQRIARRLQDLLPHQVTERAHATRWPARAAGSAGN
jgi:hypothetical protein